MFRTVPLVQHALPDETGAEYELVITDGRQGIYTTLDDLGGTSAMADVHIYVLNRQWHVSVIPTQLTKSRFLSANAEVFLLVGLLVSMALSMLLRMLMMRHVSLRESEDRFADFAAVSSDWFWETDDKLRFSYFSDRFESVTGVPPQELLGKTRREVGAPGSDPQQYDAMLAAMDAHEPFRDFEHLRQMKNGDVVSLSISGRPVFDKDGVFIGYRGIGRDISEERRTREALRDALVASEQANQAKSEFLATMSHEFRTPLNAILGFSELLRAQYFGPLGASNYVGYAEDIHSSGKHMLALVNDVLDISAIEPNKRTLHKEDLALSDVVHDGIKGIQTEAMAKEIVLGVNIPDELPLIWADRRSVLQILLNLLSNAVKFSKVSGSVAIKAEAKDSHVILSVSDTGVGIDADKMPQIMEPFAQLHSNPMLAEEGAGLGLAIVKSLVEAHGGEVQIESKPKEGTRVSIFFKR